MPKIYPPDLNDAEWAILAPLLEPPTRRGRPPTHDRRLIVNAVLYVLRGGIAWRLLPQPFPPWTAVYDHLRRWRRAGVWRRINDALRARARTGRNPQPTVAIIDSQTVRTSKAGGERGYDGGKRISGRKRHLVVDTQGFLLHARVHVANLHDRRARARWPEQGSSRDRGPVRGHGLPGPRTLGGGRARLAADHRQASSQMDLSRRSMYRRQPCLPASTSCPSAGSWSEPSPG